ncbi:MAG TPA: amidohydrolase family protein [Dehalococcoidia bacterium]|nr:amidohydrolase family protein [Dehalococcoidia bacterium]
MTTAIVNATLVDGTGADPVPNGGLLVNDDGRIERAGAGIEPPRDAEVIDAGGRTLMPGMIDCHVHLYGRVAPLQERLLTPPSLQLFYGARNALRTLDAGITTVRDAAGSPAGFKMAIERGLIPGPRMRIAIAMLSQTGGHGDSTMPAGVATGVRSGPEWPEHVVDGPDEVRRAVRELLRAGADFIKLASTGGVLSPSDEPGHTAFTPEEIGVMVYEARAAGKTCMAHAQGTQGIRNAVEAGVESIEHGIYLDDALIEDMKRRGTFLVPTLVAPVWVLRHAERAPGTVLPQSVRKTKEVMESHRESFRRAAAAGVRIAMGTDSGVGHHGSNAEELERMVEGGLTPMQAIVATTKTASECVHMQADIGTLEQGKLADLLVVDGDPLADIAVLRDPARLTLIMQGGRAHKREL